MSFADAQQKSSSASEERSDGCSSMEESGGGSSSGSTCEPDNGDDSKLVSSVPETPLQKPVISASQKSLSSVANRHPKESIINPKSEKDKALRTLRNFKHAKFAHHR